MSLLLTNMSHQHLRRGYMPVISCKGSALFRLDEKKARRFFHPRANLSLGRL